MRRFIVVVLGATLLWVAPAGATGCRDWTRASPAEKTAIVEEIISSTISGQKGRQYQVNRGQIERCLQKSAKDIEYAFDDSCANARKAGIQALNNIFKNYIWSCIN
jgi:hypothetical protein